MQYFKKFYNTLKRTLRSGSPVLFSLLNKYKTIIKYLFAGLTATSVDLGLLFIFTDLFNFHYLFSATLAFIAAFFVSFYLQKFWTFRDNNRKKMLKQLSFYLVSGLSNLVINTGGMYIYVEYFHVNYILSQIFMGMFISIINFVVYRFIIFKKHPASLEPIANGRKKLLIVTGIFPPDIGGPASYANTLRDELPKHGFEIKVVSYCDKKNCQTIKDDLYLINRDRHILLRYFDFFKTVFKLCDWSDIVYIQGPVSEGLPGSIACRLRGCQYILKVVGDYAWEQGRQRFGVSDLLDDFQTKKYSWPVELMRHIEKRVAAGATLIITPSFYLKKIVGQWGIAPEKIEVIYNAIERPEQNINKSDLKSALAVNGDLILTVARLVPWKGIDILIELMPELLAVNPDFKLIIVGDGPIKNDLIARTNSLHLEKEVIFTGSLESAKVMDYMAVSEMFVLNTGYEGLSHVIIEAMQSSLPVLASRVGGNPELVDSDKNGILFEYNDRDQIKNAILELWKNPDRKMALAAAAKASISKFSRADMINKISEIIASKI